jgi:hypothetical protein
MHPAEFEPAIPASERPQAHALDRAATEIGQIFTTPNIKYTSISVPLTVTVPIFNGDLVLISNKFSPVLPTREDA